MDSVYSKIQDLLGNQSRFYNQRERPEPQESQVQSQTRDISLLVNKYLNADPRLE